MSRLDRRELMALTAIAGVGAVVGSAAAPGALAQSYGEQPAAAASPDDLFFVQLSDTHWGFKDDKINPDFEGTLKKVVAGVNALSRQPDFVVFTGDMTHTTKDATERRRRMNDVRGMLGELKVKDVRFAPGDHDANPDKGEVYQEVFGKPYYAFDQKGVHFVVLDNVSDPEFKLGEAQLAWLASDLAQLPAAAPVIAITHRPLFELYRPWGWFTPDGDKAMELLKPRKATVFYGHVHHENHATAGGLVHHSAAALMIPLPAAGTRPERAPIAWDAASPYRGMGWRTVSTPPQASKWDIREQPIKG